MTSKWQKIKLIEIATVELCNVDKKIKPNERIVRQCNYTDIYKNWQIDESRSGSFLTVTCNEAEYKKFRLEQGQVAITKDSETKDDIGKSAYIAHSFFDTVLGYHLALITPDKDKLDGYFLNCLLHTKTLQKYFENNAGGSGQRVSLSITAIQDTPLMIPNLSMQRSIARVLSQLDEKIELNRRINAELENLARTIFIYNFVQNANPKWKRVMIGDIAEVMRGTTITEKQAQAGNVKVVAGGMNYAYFHNKHNREKNTITVSGSGASAGFVNFWNERIFASDCTTVRGKTDMDTFLIYEFLKWLQEAIYIKAKGSAQPHVYPSDIKGLSFYDIPQDVKAKFAPTYRAIHEQLAKNVNENCELAALRDFLLPLLMNGQVTVEGIA